MYAKAEPFGAFGRRMVPKVRTAGAPRTQNQNHLEAFANEAHGWQYYDQRILGSFGMLVTWDGRVERGVASMEVDEMMVLVLAALVIVVAFGAVFVGFRSMWRKRDEMGIFADGSSEQPLRDPATCVHEFDTYQEGTCENTYSSYGGGVELQSWIIERCKHCGTTRFHCSDSSCLVYEDCRERYE